MTKRWIGLAITASLFAAAGCKKDEKKPEGGSVTTPTAENPKADQAAPAPGGAAAPSAPAAVGAMPQGVDRLLASLPVESEIVIGMDAGRLKASPLLAPLFDQAMKANNAKMGFDMQAECGIDPAQLVTKFVAGIRLVSADKVDVAVAFDGLERSATMACIEKAKSKIEANGFKVGVSGNVASFEGAVDGKPAYVGMTVADDNVTVLRISNAPIDVKALMTQSAAKAGDGLTKSAEFMNMVKSTNTAATIWGLANGSSPSMQKLPLKFKAAFGSIDITDGVQANGRLRMNSPDEATNVSKLLGGQLGSIKQMGFADIAEATVDGSDVLLSFAMKKQQLENITRLASGMLQQAGGAGGGMAKPTGP
jgi:hypothetical protein